MEIKEFEKATFATNLKAARKQRDITQDKLATESHVEQNVISAYENGKYAPNLENAMKLAQALGVSVDSLCGISSEEREITPFQFISYIMTLNEKPSSAVKVKIFPNPHSLNPDKSHPVATIEFVGSEMHDFFNALEAYNGIKKQIGEDNYNKSVKMVLEAYQDCFNAGWKSERDKQREEQARLMDETPRPGGGNNNGKH